MVLDRCLAYGARSSSSIWSCHLHQVKICHCAVNKFNKRLREEGLVHETTGRNRRFTVTARCVTLLYHTVFSSPLNLQLPFAYRQVSLLPFLISPVPSFGLLKSLLPSLLPTIHIMQQKPSGVINVLSSLTRSSIELLWQSFVR